jgi:hypothetical protein
VIIAPFRLSGGTGGEHHHRRIVAVNRDRLALAVREERAPAIR